MKTRDRSYLEFDLICRLNIFDASAYNFIFSRRLHLYIVKDIIPFQHLYLQWNNEMNETEKDTISNDLWLIYSNQTAISDTGSYLESFTPLQLRLHSLVFVFYFDHRGIHRNIFNDERIWYFYLKMILNYHSLWDNFHRRLWQNNINSWCLQDQKWLQCGTYYWIWEMER